MICTDCQRVDKVVRALDEISRCADDQLAIGIDAPRMPLEKPRCWFWRKGQWTKGSGSEVGKGRHCEVVIKALGLANPQWTPLEEDAPEWMKQGFGLFRELKERDWTVHEVFPSATYRQLRCSDAPKVTFSFRRFHQAGPKDMLDAVAAAVTVSCFENGNGVEVGGGDRYGTIILPGHLSSSVNEEVLGWPMPG